MADYERLAVSDMDGIPEAILTLIASWQGLPFTATQNTVCWNNHDYDMGIGCFPQAGAVYIRRWLSGNFIGQIPIAIQYRTNPTTNKARINSQKTLEDLCRWLETCTSTFTDTHITLDKIERTSNVVKIGAYEDGSEVYQSTLNIIYTRRQ